MLIEFNVTNFRSIHDEQTLSMVCDVGKEHKDQNTFATGMRSVPNLLRSVVIYGPNAAGKSNIMEAMRSMRMFVVLSHSMQDGENIEVEPFLLNSKSRMEPSEFVVFFMQDNVRYRYGFAVNNERVLSEWLTAYPEGRPQKWFERGVDDWHIGTNLSGTTEQIKLWKASTRQNALFLSTAVQLNNEQLKPVFNWFKQKLMVIKSSGIINWQDSAIKCVSDEGKKRILEFMKAADIGILGIEVKEIRFEDDDSDLPPDILQKRKDWLARKPFDVKFAHKASDSGKVVEFDISDESRGTQKLFAIAGQLLDVLTKGSVLFIDELDTSLHPVIMRYLVSMFHDPKINKNNAQIVFTTHDTTILDAEVFRRDQVWFVEKDEYGASRLYPLSDFSPRKGEALEKGYLHGRYGALPFIGDLKF